jgi:hypothetical protein
MHSSRGCCGDVLSVVRIIFTQTPLLNFSSLCVGLSVHLCHSAAFHFACLLLSSTTMAPLRSSFSAVPQPTLMHHSEDAHVANKLDNSNNSIDHGVTQAPYERGFSPYEFNGGTVVAVAGKDYCIVAADTRLSSGYEILSRHVTKLHQLTPYTILASSGCKTDVDQLRSVLDINMKVG